MTARRRGPALLEVIRERGSISPGVRAGAARSPVAAGDGEPESLLTPGRAIRVPVGYFFFGGFLLLMAVVLGWVGGHAMAVRQYESKRAAQFEAGATPARDPLLETVSPSASPHQPSETKGDSTSAASLGERGANPDEAVRTASGTLSGRDPLTPGLNYLYAASFEAGEAERAAAFLRTSGVEAAAIATHNQRLVPVVVLTGFQAGSLSSDEARRLREEVRRLGRLWKRDHHGGTNFDGAYFVKHKPSRATGG